MTASRFQKHMSKWVARIRPLVEPNDLGEPYSGT